MTKNDHFRAMLTKARERGFRPDYAVFDSWCRDGEPEARYWLRMAFLQSAKEEPSGQSGQKKERPPRAWRYGMIKVFKTVFKNGELNYYAQDYTKMSSKECNSLSDKQEAGNRGVPHGNQAVLRDREGPREERHGNNDPHAYVPESVHPSGGIQAEDKAKLVRSDDVDNRRCDTCILGSPALPARSKCVIPMDFIYLAIRVAISAENGCQNPG